MDEIGSNARIKWSDSYENDSWVVECIRPRMVWKERF